jgi:hypothetical protein
MRRPLVALLLAAALATTAVACAHPQNIAPKPGESTTTTRANPPRTSTSTSTGTDRTAQVCRQAQSVSDDAVADLTDKLEEAQAAATAGNNAAALAAASEARRIATTWKGELKDLADQPIRADVRRTLEDGIKVIDKILNTNPQNLNPRQAQGEIEDFLDDLERVCR